MSGCRFYIREQRISTDVKGVLVNFGGRRYVLGQSCYLRSLILTDAEIKILRLEFMEHVFLRCGSEFCRPCAAPVKIYDYAHDKTSIARRAENGNIRAGRNKSTHSDCTDGKQTSSLQTFWSEST